MFCLTKIWEHTNEKFSINKLAFSSSKNLAFVSYSKCAYVFDPDGNLLNEVCGDSYMESVSYYDGKFGFTNWDEHVYITDESGGLIKKLKIGGDYTQSIGLTQNGFLACRSKCGFFDFNGNKYWDLEIRFVLNNPVFHKGYWFIPSHGLKKLFVVKNGEIVKEIESEEYVNSVGVCDNYLAMSTYYTLNLFDIRNPEEPKRIWTKSNFNGANQVAFDSSCKYIAVANQNGKKLEIISLDKKTVLSREYNAEVTSVAWQEDRIAVGLWDMFNGYVRVYKIGKLKMLFSLSRNSFS